MFRKRQPCEGLVGEHFREKTEKVQNPQGRNGRGSFEEQN